MIHLNHLHRAGAAFVASLLLASDAAAALAPVARLRAPARPARASAALPRAPLASRALPGARAGAAASLARVAAPAAAARKPEPGPSSPAKGAADEPLRALDSAAKGLGEPGADQDGVSKRVFDRSLARASREAEGVVPAGTSAGAAPGLSPAFSARAGRLAPPVPPAGLTEAELRDAFARQREAELARTIARASAESPAALRSALRAAVEAYLPEAPRLQRHLTVLDSDGDGRVSLGEGYRTLRDMGFGRLRAGIIAGGAQLALVATTGRVGFFSFRVDGGPTGLHRTVHSGAMDPAQPLEAKLDEFMAEDLDRDGFIGMKDLTRLVDKRAAASSSGRVATALIRAANLGEFSALFSVRGGRMSREDLRDFYTGSLFLGLLSPEALARRIALIRRPS